MKKIGGRQKRAGMALGTVLALTALVMLTMMTLSNLCVGAMRLTSNGRDKAISLSLAEAGIDRAVDEIRVNNDYSGTNGPVSLPGGTYNVVVTSVPGSDNLKDVYATGTTTNGKTRQVRARVNISGLTIGNGAMISNGDVIIKGSVNVQTVDDAGTTLPNQRIANVRANGDVTGNGSATVDGRVTAAGTVSIGGVTATGGTQSGAARISFPTETTIAEWKKQWIDGAKAGGTMTAAEVMANVNASPPQPITGPKYISGNITLDGGKRTLTFLGSGPIYIDGDVYMKGNSTLKNASTLIVSGKFTQVGNTLDETPDPTYEAYEINSGNAPPGLMSLSPDLDDAISLTGGATNNQYSLIYAVYGGIDVQGNTKVNGSLVAGGKGATITATGNYTHSYPKDSVNRDKSANAPAVQSWIEM